jgi:hypothetical protein
VANGVIEELNCPVCGSRCLTLITGDYTDRTLFFIIGFLSGSCPDHSEKMRNMGSTQLVIGIPDGG